MGQQTSQPVDCSITQQYLNECLQKKSEDCKWVQYAHEMCIGKITHETLLKQVQEELERNPKTPTKKICCTCKPTKSVRDDCFAKYGEDKCKEIIEAHKLCLRSEGFKDV